MFPFILIVLPITGAFISWGIGRTREQVRDWFVILLTGVELAIAAALFLAIWTSGHAQAGAFAAGTAATPEAAGTAVTVCTWSLPGILAGGLSFRADGFRVTYALITALMWAFTSLFGREYFAHEREGLNRYWFFVLVTLGATEGVMLSGDLMTAFIFFEILSFTSFTWVIHEQTEDAIKAGYTYLFIAVIGGLVLFMGLALLYDTVGTLSFENLYDAVREACTAGAAGLDTAGAGAATGAAAAALSISSAMTRIRIAGICVLFGFGAKAGMVPVHVWLPKAHPVAPSPASALLSGVLTKVGIYGILMISLHALRQDIIFGVLVLTAGLVTMLLGAVLALFSVNLKRTLACSSMSQIGFILTGVGMMILHFGIEEEEGITIAMSGLMLHMVNHSLIKLTLFMAAGVVVMNLHTLTLDEIRGWGRKKHALKFAFAMGALGISGVPMMNGYISKTLLHESIVEGIHHLGSGFAWLKGAEWVFLFTGGLTFCYMLKLFICIFVEKNADSLRQQMFDGDSRKNGRIIKKESGMETAEASGRPYMNRFSTFAIVGSSLLCPLLGQGAVSKHLAAFMTGREEILEFAPFTLTNLKGSLISLSIGAAVYVLVVRLAWLRRDGHYVNHWPAGLDLEEKVYRPVLTVYLPCIFGAIAALFGENRILRPFSVHALDGVKLLGRCICGSVDHVFLPVLKGITFGLAVLSRVLENSLDALVMLLRRTLLREKRRRGGPERGPGLPKAMALELSDALRPIFANFSFALMMTCIGIIVILVAIIYYSVL